jgi:hypothetical protein
MLQEKCLYITSQIFSKEKKEMITFAENYFLSGVNFYMLLSYYLANIIGVEIRKCKI